MEMVIGNEELNFIILSQFYSIIDCYVFLLFPLILIVIYSFSIDVSWKYINVKFLWMLGCI